MEFYKQLSKTAKIGLGIGCGLIALMTLMIVIWLFQPKYQTMFNNLDQQDAAQMVQQLKDMAVDYRIEDQGQSIAVEKSNLHETRLALMSQDINLKNGVGLELFNNSDYGKTAFEQQVNYQRAMQGELARTIMALEAVKFARVHLTIPKDGLLLSRKQNGKASVTLLTYNDQELTPQQISGVQRLVAAAINGLEAENVTVLNSSGQILSDANENSHMAAENRHQKKALYESNLEAKIIKVLQGMMEMERFNVSVDAVFDYNKVKRINNNIIKPKAEVIVRKKEKHTNSKPAKKSGNKNTSSNKSIDVEYAHGKSIEEIEYSIGSIKRLTVAVALPGSFDKKTLSKLERLIGAAIGLNAERGDVLYLNAFDFKGKSVNLPSSISRSENVDAPNANQSTDEEVASLNAMRTRGNNSLVSTTDDSTEIFSILKTSDSQWNILYLAITLLGLALIILLFSFRKWRTGPKNLSQEEKEQLLLEVKTWLKVQ